MTEIGQNDSIGMHLRRLRKDRGMTLEDVCNALGMMPATVSRIETGRRSVSTETLSALANLYGQSVAIVDRRSEIAANQNDDDWAEVVTAYGTLLGAVAALASAIIGLLMYVRP